MPSFNTNLIHQRLQQIADSVDAAATPGRFYLLDGTPPPKGGALTNILVTGTFSDPSFQTPASEMMISNAITGANVAMTGTITWYRLVDGDDNFVADGLASELILSSTNVTAGQSSVFNNIVITGGNL